MSREFEIDEIDDRDLAGDLVLHDPRRNLVWNRVFHLVIATGLGGVVYLLVSSQATHCGEGMRRAACVNNLKQLALALHNYHDVYGSFPPAYVADATGRPMHSWRVLLLPFLEQEGLYREFDFLEPWDGPKNIKLIARMPYLFACPSAPHGREGRTNYVAIAGPDTMFPGATPVKISDVSDGLNATLMVVETRSFSVPWTAPVDLDVRTMSMQINDLDGPSISSGHVKGADAAFGDGTVRFLKNAQPAQQLRTYTTIRAGDRTPDDDGSQSF